MAYLPSPLHDGNMYRHPPNAKATLLGKLLVIVATRMVELFDYQSVALGSSQKVERVAPAAKAKMNGDISACNLCAMKEKKRNP